MEVICKQCNIMFNKIASEIKRSKNHFCSRSCAASFNNKTFVKRVKTEKIKLKKEIKEKVKPANPFEKFKESLFYKSRSTNLIKLGFNFDNDILYEYQKIQTKLKEHYIVNNESMLTIMKLYNIPSSKTIHTIFDLFEINTRTLSEAQVVSYLENRAIAGSNFQFKTKWHTTWNNKQVYLRSSYEIKYAEDLDKNQINYEVESLKISYFDTQLQKERVAVPDFYIPESNTIVEVKSTYWLDLQNMKDKLVAYKALDYNFILNLDHVLLEHWGSNPGHPD